MNELDALTALVIAHIHGSDIHIEKTMVALGFNGSPGYHNNSARMIARNKYNVELGELPDLSRDEVLASLTILAITPAPVDMSYKIPMPPKRVPESSLESDNIRQMYGVTEDEYARLVDAFVNLQEAKLVKDLLVDVVNKTKNKYKISFHSQVIQWLKNPNWPRPLSPKQMRVLEKMAKERVK